MRPGGWLAGLRALLRRDADRREIDDELQAYLDQAGDAAEAAGMDRATAMRAARASLGSPLARREEVQAVGWEHRVETTVQDIRFAGRLIRRSPGFSAVVIVTLALGIGGNTAIATLINSLYFHQLPFPDVDRVLRLLDATSGADGQQRLSSMHSPNVVDVRRETAIFDSTVAMFGEDLTLTDGTAPERLMVVFRTSGWDQTLGVRPAVGRDFTADEERRGRDSAVALIE